MEGLFWLPFLLVYLAGAGSTLEPKSCVMQPKMVIWKKIGETAVLKCSFNSSCKGAELQFKWFVVKRDSHQHIELNGNGKYKLNGGSLHINSLNVNDTGRYLCAAETRKKTCCLPFVGEGLTLIVGESKVRYILLWLLFTLLAIYSLALVMLIITKKHGCNLSFSKMTSKTETNSLKKKTQFRDVLQELHSRGNVNKRKQSIRGNGSQLESASGGANFSTDDIYQNV